MSVILALDQGTTSSRAILFDRDTRVLAVAQREFRQIYPQPGWVEHDAEEIWASQIGVASEVLARTETSLPELAAIGITNQRETTIVWERATGRPVCNAIVWQDRRTAAVCDRLRAEGHEPLIQRKTGLLIDAYFSGTKLQWILDHIPGARAQAERGELAFGTVDSWLVYKLTGGRVHVTDVSNASRTMLFNIHERAWDEDLLALLNIPRAILPEVRSSSEVYGHTSFLGLGGGVPIAGIAGDQQAALFGQMCFDPGMAKITYGTGGFLLMNTGARAVESRHRLLTTVAWQVGAQVEYALEGSIFIAGAATQWLRDGLGLIKSSREIEHLAASVPDNGGVYFIPAFVGLGAPHWDPYARGTITGLTRGTTAAHLARAAEEAIAFQVADVVRALEADSGIACRELRADGGAAVDNLLLQIQSDMLGIRVLRPALLETTALGAAALAGLAVGFWKDRAELAAHWGIDRTFEPELKSETVARLRGGWEKALARAKGWAEGE